MLTDVIERKCEVCQTHTQLTPLTRYMQSVWPLVECQTCQFVFLRQAPHYAALIADEAWEKNHASEAKRRKKITMYRFDYATRFRLRIGKWLEEKRLERMIGATGRALDIGCGGDVKLPQGLVPYGIEISSKNL